MKRVRSAVFALISALTALSIPMTALAHHKSDTTTFYFGREPVTIVQQKAARWITNLSITDLTTDEFAAMIMAVTWPETQHKDTGRDAPSPMTMGRWDGGYSRLWSGGTTSTTEPRDLFHAGVGAWQIDSSQNFAPFANLDASGSIDVYTASDVVAQVMGERWKSVTGTKQERRRLTWSRWFGCHTSSSNLDGIYCEHNFSQIYDSATGKLRLDTRLMRVDSVTRLGGAVWTSCAYTWATSNTWSCLEVDTVNAQGNKNFTSNPDGGGGELPLTKRFYVYNSGGYEYRVWKRQHSPVYGTDWIAKRQLGYDARTSNTWDSSEIICAGGYCP